MLEVAGVGYLGRAAGTTLAGRLGATSGGSHTVGEGLIRMTRLEVSARHRRRGAAIVRVMGAVVILAAVAVVVIGHVCVHIGLIMAQVDRCRTVVAAGVVVPIVGRNPDGISVSAEVCEHRRRADVDGAHVVVRTVDIRRADDLHVGGRVTHLNGERGHVLEDIRREDGLDQDDVVVALDGLDNAEVVDITVAVEVERREHVIGRVEQHLKLTERVGLAEGGCYGAEVEEEAEVLVEGRHLYDCGSRAGGAGFDHGSGGRRLYIRMAVHHAGAGLRIDDGCGFGCHGRGDDTGQAAAAKQGNGDDGKELFHILRVLLVLCVE